MNALIRMILRTLVEIVLRRLEQALRRPPEPEPEQAQIPPGWYEPSAHEPGYRPSPVKPMPVPAMPRTIPKAGADGKTKYLSAHVLRNKLKDPKSLRQAILINEILSKPVALRRR